MNTTTRITSALALALVATLSNPAMAAPVKILSWSTDFLLMVPAGKAWQTY